MQAPSTENTRLSARVLPSRAPGRIELAAFYGAFALIAAIVFGTLSVHPF